MRPIITAIKFLLAITIAIPLCSQQVSYSLYTIPLIGKPHEFSKGMVDISPEKLISKTKNNSPQMFIPIDARFSISINWDSKKEIDSLHIGLDDNSSNALGEIFYIREAGEIFREFRKPGGNRVRVQANWTRALGRQVTIEFLDDTFIKLDSGSSMLRSIISLMPGCNKFNYMIKINTNSKIALLSPGVSG